MRVFQSGGNGHLRKNADPGEVARAVKKILNRENMPAMRWSSNWPLMPDPPRSSYLMKRENAGQTLRAGQGMYEKNDVLLNAGVTRTRAPLAQGSL